MCFTRRAGWLRNRATGQPRRLLDRCIEEQAVRILSCRRRAFLVEAPVQVLPDLASVHVRRPVHGQIEPGGDLLLCVRVAGDQAGS